MMGLGLIRAISNEQAYRATEAGTQPLELWQPEDIRTAPFIGYKVPDGFTMTRVFFVDSSGWGAPDEPALTFSQLQKVVVRGRFYAIVETGQFQIHIAEYVPEGEEVEVELEGKGIYPPDSIEAESSNFESYKERREASEGYWYEAAERLGGDIDIHEAMDGGYGDHMLVESVEEAIEYLYDWGLAERPEETT